MGVPGLDDMLGGGLPRGYSLLVAGPSGSGKSMLAAAFLAEGARCGETGVLAAFESTLAHLVCTQNSTPRSMPAEELAQAAREVFGDDRVSVAPPLADAIEQAATLAEAGDAVGSSLSAGAVLVTGSVVTVGEARALLKGGRS